MTKVKIELDIDVSNPKQLGALNALFAAMGSSNPGSKDVPFPDNLDEKPENEAEETEDAKPKSSTKPTKKEKPSPKNEVKSEYTLPELRTLIAEKAKEYGVDKIKKGLTKLGAENATTLDPEKYPDMVEYLNSL